MNEMIEKLPSLRNMLKLIAFLILALIALWLISAIVKTLLPVAIIAALIAGAWYLLSGRQRR